MSQLLINQYLGDLDRLRRISGANRESVVREAFKDLLKAWGRCEAPSLAFWQRPSSTRRFTISVWRSVRMTCGPACPMLLTKQLAHLHFMPMDTRFGEDKA
jgi:hypothetical protein